MNHELEPFPRELREATRLKSDAEVVAEVRADLVRLTDKMNLILKKRSIRFSFGVGPGPYNIMNFEASKKVEPYDDNSAIG